MKKLFAITSLMLILAGLAFAQSGREEQEIMKIHNSLDQAFLNKDITAFERVFEERLLIQRRVSPCGRDPFGVHRLQELRTRQTGEPGRVVPEHVQVVSVSRTARVHARRRDPRNVPEHLCQVLRVPLPGLSLRAKPRHLRQQNCTLELR